MIVKKTALIKLLFNNISFINERPLRLTDVFSWHQHIPFAFWLVAQLKPKLFVELGVHKGDSYSAICQGIQANNLDSKCYGVDTWQGEEHAGKYSDDVYEEFKSFNDINFGRNSYLMRMTFDEALAYFGNGSIDLLHIDGRHHYNDLKHDFETWLPKVSQNGVVLFHDISVREREFGVWRFFEELKLKYPTKTFSFDHGYGLGMLLVGEHCPSSLKQLCNLEHDDTSFVKNIFSTLGQLIRSISIEQEITDYKKRVFVLEEQVFQTNSCSEQLKIEITENANRNEKIIRYKDEKISQLLSAIEGIESKSIAIQEDLKLTRTNEIKAMKATIENLHIQSRADEISKNLEQFEMAKQIKYLSDSIFAKDEIIANKTELLAEKSQLLINTSAQLDDSLRKISDLWSSRSMRITAPLRRVSDLIRSIINIYRLILSAISYSGGVIPAITKCFGLYRKFGLDGLRRGVAVADEFKKNN
jgi:hypothetical protein